MFTLGARMCHIFAILYLKFMHVYVFVAENNCEVYMKAVCAHVNQEIYYICGIKATSNIVVN